MPTKLEWHGLNELLDRLRNMPSVVNQVMRTTIDAALLVIWENVPSYPPQPATTDYRRTGTLGRSLGTGEGGGRGGTPDIYEVKELGGGLIVGEFGTRLGYAPYVIGDRASEQARHMKHWWTLPNDVVEKAHAKIIEVYGIAMEKLAEYIAGKGL